MNAQKIGKYNDSGHRCHQRGGIFICQGSYGQVAILLASQESHLENTDEFKCVKSKMSGSLR